MPLQQQYQEAYDQANRYDQEHLFQFWNEMNLPEKLAFLKELERVDYKQLERLYDQRNEQVAALKEPITVAPVTDKQDLQKKTKRTGEQALKEGTYAVLLLAGGQASRLGYDGPKGCYPATAIKHKTLFQLYAEKVLAASKYYNKKIELYIMLGEHNYKTSIDYFKQNDYFGLEEEQLVFFKQQGKMPAMSFEGKLLLAKKTELFFAPNGTGDVYKSLQKADLFKRMKQKGVKIIHYVQIDDALTQIADPYYIGYHLEQEADVTINAVEKTDPDEPVGLVATRGSHVGIVEYVYLPEKFMHQRDKDGRLTYRAVNTGISLMNTTFMERAANEDYTYYLAKKKVPYVDKEGILQQPKEPNAYKFESFSFDKWDVAKKVATLLGRREEEFGPIKNPDDAKTKSRPVIQQMMTNMFKQWLLAIDVNLTIVDNLEEIEISPLLAFNEDTFIEKAKPHKKLIEQQLKGKKKAYLR